MPFTIDPTPAVPALPDLHPPLPAAILAFEDQARDYARHAKAANTRRAYAADWADFARWCTDHQAIALPAAPATLLAYLIASADRVKVSTLQRRLVAVREAHAQAGYRLETDGAAFRDAWRGLRRRKGVPAAQKAPLLTADLRRALASLSDETLIGLRDRAVLLLGFAAALRRSELASLTIGEGAGANHVTETADGLVITLARSKTDQLGAGHTIGVPYGSHPATCPVRAHKRWMEASGITRGPLFRAVNRHGTLAAQALSDKAVVLIVKRAIVSAALAEGVTLADATAHAARFSGHSLRAGLATSAAANDAPGHAIQRQLRHRKFETTVGYIRQGQLFKQNAASMAGL